MKKIADTGNYVVYLDHGEYVLELADGTASYRSEDVRDILRIVGRFAGGWEARSKRVQREAEKADARLEELAEIERSLLRRKPARTTRTKLNEALVLLDELVERNEGLNRPDSEWRHHTDRAMLGMVAAKVSEAVREIEDPGYIDLG